jgi:hypothetical protein
MTAKPYTFDVMTPRGWNDSPITVLAADYYAAADLAARLVAAERGHEVLDVMDATIVIADESDLTDMWRTMTPPE